MVTRRAFIGTLAGGLLAAPLATEAQRAGKVSQIGYLIYGSPASVAQRTEALRMRLRDLGYVEDKNITFAFRSAETANRLPEVAADLVRLKVDVIFATSSTEVEAARQATKTIPSRLMPIRRASATSPALHGPAATSRGCHWSSPRPLPRNSR